ncbi:RING-finger domain-containing protein [Mycena indigotica]|uniref:RING-finger domain-containing protein n=1 Tax=Mycena indigotica TaxID=2126181 RepID=A0A8H6TGG1_9AGAR|nr:RING-finger domain-containing protein [Mycena indigotica]KAF7316297.1 RING-finger domain-containing protein [Mycena indigotica]
MSGLPLLSGPPPVLESTRADATSCRKCSKDFNFLLARPRRCNHCGYMYCHSCTDFQALMPRTGAEMGYDAVNVCGYCIEYLTITAGGRAHLRSLTLPKLKKYISAYNIKGAERAVEKNDLIEAIMAAKGDNGCLTPAHESYYRKYSVPDRSNVPRRGLFSRSSASTNTEPPPPPPRPHQTPTYEFPRPDLAPDIPLRPTSQPSTQQQHSSPPPRPATSRPAYHNPNDQYHSQTHFPSPQHAGPPVAPRATRPNQGPRPSRSSHNLNAQANGPPPRARAASSAHPPPPPGPPSVPPPSLDQLLSMTSESVGALPVHALKALLFANHVNLGQGALEKSDLVKKVIDLVEEERRTRERRRLEEEAEEEARIEQQRVMMEQFQRQQRERAERERAEAAAAAQDEHPTPDDSASPPSAPTESETEFIAAATPSPPPLPKPKAIHVERTGLCVICQDEEANIAIVDCGHLAMCRECSELVMNSSRECPLCRTRIVTEARLLRIFKT